MPRRQELAKRQPHAAHVLVQVDGSRPAPSTGVPRRAELDRDPHRARRARFEEQRSRRPPPMPGAGAPARRRGCRQRLPPSANRRFSCLPLAAPTTDDAAVGADAVFDGPSGGVLVRVQRPCCGAGHCGVGGSDQGSAFRRPTYTGFETSHGTGGCPGADGQCHLYAIGGRLRGLLHRQRATGARPRRFRARREEAASGRRATAGAAALSVTGPPARAPRPAPPMPLAFDPEKSSHAGPASASTTDTTRPARIASSGRRGTSAGARSVKRSPGTAIENVRNIDS